MARRRVGVRSRGLVRLMGISKDDRRSFNEETSAEVLSIIGTG